ncbi:MAG TPA: hypothetical protein VLI06_13565 [Solimonas sp.]|nr:hypothetical protein [Solimonas sp.]
MRRLLPAVILSCAAVQASAFDAEFELQCGNLVTCQRDFRSISEDITAALNYKALGPAEATGITGIGIGVIASYVEVDDTSAWQNVTGEDVDAVGMAGVVVRKGLPLGLDVGAFYASVPGADADLYGGELRWAILEGGVAEPALAVRGSFTRASGIDDFDYEAYGLDVSVSKGFTFLTPYAGYGYVWSEVDPHGTAGLEKEEVDGGRFFAGLRIGIALLDITPEYEHIEGRDAFNLLLGLSF